MSSSLAKLTILVGLSSLAIAVAYPFGPLGNIPTTFAVSDGYLALARNHELYLGFVGFFSAFLANYWVRASNITVILGAIIGGSLIFVLAQASDPEFFSYFAVAFTGFHSHYLASGLVVALTFVALNHWRSRG